jgi:hypothetical protein
MFLNAYVVFVDKADALKAYIDLKKAASTSAETIVGARFEPHFVYVTPEQGWVRELMPAASHRSGRRCDRG